MDNKIKKILVIFIAANQLYDSLHSDNIRISSDNDNVFSYIDRNKSRVIIKDEENDIVIIENKPQDEINPICFKYWCS